MGFWDPVKRDHLEWADDGRSKGIVDCQALGPYRGSEWRVRVRGNGGRWASVVCPTRKEALELGKLLVRRMKKS